MPRATPPPIPRAPGRPRSPEAGERILRTASELLGKRGFEGLSIDEIASSAGVGKATIYRRWPSKEAIVIAALERFVVEIRLPDTGSMRSDLQGLLADAVRVYSSPRSRLLPALASAMEHHPRLAAAVRRRFFEPRRRSVTAILERARDRGELAADADLELIHDLLAGPFVYRRLFTGGPVDRSLVDGIVEAVLSGFGSRSAAAARAGEELDRDPQR